MQAEEVQNFFDSSKGHRSQWRREFLLLLWIKLGSNYCHGAEGVQLAQQTRGILVLCRSRKVWYYFLGEIESHLGNNVIGSWKILIFLCALIFNLSANMEKIPCATSPHLKSKFSESGHLFLAAHTNCFCLLYSFCFAMQNSYHFHSHPP